MEFLMNVLIIRKNRVKIVCKVGLFYFREQRVKWLFADI